MATTAVVSTAFVFVYAALLSLEGIPASTLALLAVLLAATLASVAGFAFSAICGVMLLQIMNDPVQVVEVMIVCSIAIQSVSVAMLWRDIDWRRVMILLAGGIVGLPIGVWLLLHLGHLWFKEAIGGLLIAYAALRLLRRPWVLESGSDLADTCIGFLGGITGGLAGFPGAAVTIWCGMKGWDKRRQRGIYQPFILVMQVVALLLIHFMRSSSVARSVGLGLDPLQFVPVALLGTWFGLVIFRRLSDRSFALSVNLLLLVSGVGLLV
ncbi:MAG TPA: sulfite exporter TauE/SafE family protein [Acetobacteraceae bacterium]|nr:sulfite exporter TauE/SafE family protein [Acetobacteraceae bacterium]